MISKFSIALFFRGSIFDLRRRQNTIFWIGQIAVVLSTIFGVYLASSEGLKSAMEFHTATTTEKKYFTLSALKTELETNNNLIVAFSENNLVKDNDGQITGINSVEMPELNWFVWLTMTQTEYSLELPVNILRDVNRYYLALTKLIASYERSAGRDKLFKAKALDKLTKQTSADLIPQLGQRIKIYEKRLSQYSGLGYF